MAITSRDVARLAGVSQPTVSRTLRDDPGVAPETRARVHKAVAALGYVPSEAGRSLVTRVSKRVGVVVSDLTNPFYPHLIAPLHDELGRHGFRTMVLTERSDTHIVTNQLMDGSIDGVVLLTSTTGSVLPAELHRRGLPFVFLNRESAIGLGDAAVVDNARGGQLAANRLTELGHRDIAGIFGPEHTSTGRERELGFRLALADSGIALSPEYVQRGPFEFDTGYNGLRALLNTTPRRPTAVFCGNDVIAIGALNAALNVGVAVPRDLSIIGFDDIPMAAWEIFQLTTIGHDLDHMAITAANLLVTRIAAGGKQLPPRRVVLEPALVERRTAAAIRDRA